MRFKTITLQNFFSFGPQPEIVDLERSGMNLILGENGMGKSVLFDGITFAIYGKTTKDIKVARITNERTGKNTLVQLHFELNGSIYWIDRYRLHKEHKNTVKLFKDTYDEAGLISKADNADTQEAIEDLIKISHKAFVNSIVMGQKNVKGFLEESPAKKKEVIENILQLNQFSKYEKISNEKKKIVNRKTASIDIQVDGVANVISSIEKNLKDYLESCNKAKQEDQDIIVVKQAEIDDINKADITQELENIRVATEKTIERDQMKAEHDKIIAQSERFVQEKSESESSLNEYDDKIEKAKQLKAGYLQRAEYREVRIKKLEDILSTQKEISSEAVALSKKVEQLMVDYQQTLDRAKIFKHEKENHESSLIEYKEFIASSMAVIGKAEIEVLTLDKRIHELTASIEETEANPDICPVCTNHIDEEKMTLWLSEQKEFLSQNQGAIKEHSDRIDSERSKITGWTIKTTEIEDNVKKCTAEMLSIAKDAKVIKDEYEAIEIPKTLDEDAIRKLEDEKEELEEQDLKKFAEEQNVNLAVWEVEVKNLKEGIAKCDIEISNIEQDAKLIRDQYEAIEIPETKDEEWLKSLSETKSKLEAEIKALSEKKYQNKEHVKGMMDQRVAEKEKMKDLKDERRQLVQDAILYQFWENSFSNKKNSIKSWCINNIIGYYNAQIKSFIDRFFSGDVEIQLDKDLQETIKYKGYPREFDQFSEGQKRRLNLAILFATNKLVKANAATKVDVMFLDEVLSNFLDNEGIAKAMTLLEEMKEDGETIFVIDHSDDFKNHPSFKKMEVYKDSDDFSHIKIL